MNESSLDNLKSLLPEFYQAIGETLIMVGVSSAVGIIFIRPWLDRSPVKSIRYKGWISRVALALFIIAFLTLTKLGTMQPTNTVTLLAQFFTAVYFAFFLLMPIYSKLDKTKPVPTRVTK